MRFVDNLAAELRTAGHAGVRNIITRTAHCESFTMNGTGYILNGNLAAELLRTAGHAGVRGINATGLAQKLQVLPKILTADPY